MRYFMTVWLIIKRVSASPLLTNSLPESLLDYDDTFSSNWMVPSQPSYSLSQNDLGNGCVFKDGSVSCGSVDPLPALPSQSPPLEDSTSQLDAPSIIQEATIAATNDKKCDYHEVRTYLIQMGYLMLNPTASQWSHLYRHLQWESISAMRRCCETGWNHGKAV